MIKTLMHSAAVVTAAFSLAAFSPAGGQQPPAKTKQQRDSTPMNDLTATMSSEPLGVSMERMGSGTTWIPDAVSLPSGHFMAGKWDLMLHGFVFGQYDKQG